MRLALLLNFVLAAMLVMFGASKESCAQATTRAMDTGDIPRALLFARSGRELFSVDRSGTSIWDVISGTRLHRWESLQYAVSLSPDGAILVGFKQDKTVSLVDVATYEELTNLKSSDQTGGLENPCCALAFSEDGRNLAVACGRTVDFWKKIEKHGKAWEKVWTWSANHDNRFICFLGFFGKRNQLAVSYYLGSRTAVIDTTTGKVSYWCPTLKYLTSASVSKNGGLFAAAIDGYLDQINIFDTSTQIEALSLRKISLKVRVDQLSFSPNGKALGALCNDGTLKLFEIRSGGCIEQFAIEKTRLCAFAFSPLGSHIAFGADNGKITVRKLLSGE